jgi:prepilin-type N-terminal cleavage/methylation domain-containing protein
VFAQRRHDREGDGLIERGFTLVELLIVIVILGILAGIVVFAVGNLTTNAKAKGCAAEKTTITNALESYKAYTGSYPTATAAGGGSHIAMDLLTGNATTTPAPGTLLKTVPTLYGIDNAGVVSPTAAGTTAGCT